MATSINYYRSGLKLAMIDMLATLNPEGVLALKDCT